MNPRAFLDLASTLMRSLDPPELRTAISRAYYATYNVRVEILKEMGATISVGPAGHGEVANCLGNSGDLEVKKVGSQLTDLHGKRIRADYRLDRRDVEHQKTVQGLVEQAKNMIQTLDACRSEPKFSQIKNTIQEYQRVISRPRS